MERSRILSLNRDHQRRPRGRDVIQRYCPYVYSLPPMLERA